MNNPKNININDYNYNLPEEKIAFSPCKNRDESKLLIFKDNTISEDTFKHIPQYLPGDSLLVFNNTRVIQARILFPKPTGSIIEIFCLEPLAPTTIHSLIFETKGCCEWECFVGNNKRFTTPLSLEFNYGGQSSGILHAERIGKHSSASFRIRFSWAPETLSFAEVLDSVGNIPLPPYIKRKAIHDDTERYQTIYAKEKGSVAAPTAGLHFTTEVLEKIRKENIPTEYITLHVGAGTFKPVTETCIENHTMHCEQLLFTKGSIKQFLHYKDKKIIAVGTTTARSLESLYWIGVKLAASNQEYISENNSLLHIAQWEVYESLIPKQLSVEQSLQAILNFMDKNDINTLHASTALMITPDYQPKMVRGIVTNFHQPQSTLLLLISAFVGGEWKNIYKYAISHDFRFLSYGDACLFL